MGWIATCLAPFAISQDFPPTFKNPSVKQPAATPKANNAPRQGIDRTAMRPALPDPSVASSTRSTGVTLVDLEPGLGRMRKGDEPRNQAELISLEKQQTKVAEKVNLVTVNLQHGSTQGSGVIITGSGYILTAAHVAGRPNQKINIILHDGSRVEGVSMGVNRNSDAGLVRITKARDTAIDPWPHATLGASADLQLGQWVIATGHPGGWMSDRPAVVRIGRLLRVLPSTLVTDCSLIGGDSGGPLFDLEGKLIGIHSRIGIDVDDNMHVPVDVFDESWSRLVQNEAWGSLPGFKPAIGVRGASDKDSENMCKIGRVEPNNSAAKAGIRAGDVILKFDNVPIHNFDDLKAAVDSVTPGEQVTVDLQRDSKQMSVRLIVGVRE
jgi:serine protease Do